MPSDVSATRALLSLVYGATADTVAMCVSEKKSCPVCTVWLLAYSLGTDVLTLVGMCTWRKWREEGFENQSWSMVVVA